MLPIKSGILSFKNIMLSSYLMIVGLLVVACNDTSNTHNSIPPSESSKMIVAPIQSINKSHESASAIITNESGSIKDNLATESINHTGLFPTHRIIAYYGNPLSKRMGALGENDSVTMIANLKKEVAKWNTADPQHAAIPALHLIVTVAQGNAGSAGLYRMVMPDKIVQQVYDLAQENHALLFLDIQTGHDDIRNLLPRFEWILKNPDVHLGIDPEFNLISSQAKPGTKIGTYDAKDINYVSSYLEKIVKQYNLPPKILVVHRFTEHGVTNAKKIQLRPDVQIVMDMDGWGPPAQKINTYYSFIASESVEYTGFKLFYHNDIKTGTKMMTPNDVLKLNPQPLYIQYQ
jgi:hypothetical protein